LAPHGQLQVDLGDSVLQQLTNSAMRDTVTAIARWTWTEAEKQ
jgi:ribulose kinase